MTENQEILYIALLWTFFVSAAGFALLMRRKARDMQRVAEAAFLGLNRAQRQALRSVGLAEGMVAEGAIHPEQHQLWRQLAHNQRMTLLRAGLYVGLDHAGSMAQDPYLTAHDLTH